MYHSVRCAFVSSVTKYCPLSTVFKPALEHSLDNFWSSDSRSPVAVHRSEGLRRLRSMPDVCRRLRTLATVQAWVNGKSRPLMSAAGTNALLFTAMDQHTRGTRNNSSDVGTDNTRNKAQTSLRTTPVARRCATPCRRPSAASAASASLSPPAHQAPPRFSCCRTLASPCAPWRNAPPVDRSMLL